MRIVREVIMGMDTTSQREWHEPEQSSCGQSTIARRRRMTVEQSHNQDSFVTMDETRSTPRV